MECMSSNTESPRRYFGDSSHLTNLILDSGTTCHMLPYILDFIPGLGAGLRYSKILEASLNFS